jgi:hypothetical protein
MWRGLNIDRRIMSLIHSPLRPAANEQQRRLTSASPTQRFGGVPINSRTVAGQMRGTSSRFPMKQGHIRGECRPTRIRRDAWKGRGSRPAGAHNEPASVTSRHTASACRWGRTAPRYTSSPFRDRLLKTGALALECSWPPTAPTDSHQVVTRGRRRSARSGCARPRCEFAKTLSCRPPYRR